MDKCLESNQKEKLIKENLIFKLVNTRYNSDYLQDAPHREIGDMSVVYCWKISDKLFGKLTNNVMEKLGWTEEMLYEMAYKNTREMNPPVLESIYEAIKTGPYGRCVFHCDNNVVDHQITNIENTDGSNISFSMSGFTSDGASRYCKIMGTKGDITADMTKNIIEIGLFGQPREVIDVTKLATDFSGHGGGDVRMVLEFLEMITTGKEPQGITSLEQSINSHLVAFAAEESRLNHGAPVEIG